MVAWSELDWAFPTQMCPLHLLPQEAPMATVSPYLGDGDETPVAGRCSSPAPDELGGRLAELRLAAGQSVEQVAAKTRIRGGLIRSMEAGDFAACGGAVYARGHLRAIAAALGADGSPLVAEFDRLSGVPVDRPAAQPEPLPTVAMGRDIREPGGGTGWTLAMIAVVALFVVIAAVSFAFPGHHATATAQQGSRSHTGTTSGVAPSPLPVATGVAPTGTLADAGVNVTVRIHDSPSWVHVVDGSGALLFQGTLQPGQSMPFHSSQLLRFVFGFAPAVDLTVNGRDVGAPPASGTSQVVTVVYGPQSG